MKFIQIADDGRAEIKTEHSTLLVDFHCEYGELLVQEINVLVVDGYELPVDMDSTQFDFEATYDCLNAHIKSECDDAMLARAGV